MSTDSQLVEPATGLRSYTHRLARGLFLSAIEACERGTLHLRDVYGTRSIGSGDGVVADLTVRNTGLYPRVVFGGAVAFGEAYCDGDWDSSDLVSLLEFFTLNRESLEGAVDYLNVLKPLRKVYHWKHGNSVEGSRENIKAHYDIGNDFYELFLDESMTYSSAYFARRDQSLADAQREKYRRLSDRLDIETEDHVLEIGSGWGGFARYLAENRGCRVTTTTISREQYEWTETLVEENDLEDRITVLERDYRDLDGRYDCIVSVEMIEAVGEKYLPVYFETLERLLKSGGTVGLQLIHILDHYYDTYRHNVDFIQRYVFPGGHLPSLGRIREELSTTSLAMTEYEEIGDSYFETLEHWKRRLMSSSDSVRDLGYDDQFLRLWEYYFSYCQAGFKTGLIGNAQIVLEKPRLLQDV